MKPSLLILSLVSLLSLLPGAQAQQSERHVLALLVASPYQMQGEGEARVARPTLEFADDDLYRIAMTLSLSMDEVTFFALTEPDPQVATALPALGVRRWMAPTGPNLRRALSDLSTQAARLRAEDPDAIVSVFVYISAHGERDKGFHLEDGVFLARELKQFLGSVQATSVMVIADSCYGSVIGKGDIQGAEGASPSAEKGHADNEVGEVLVELDSVGSVTASGVLLEDRTYIRGGVLTHVLSSALLGGAETGRSGEIDYRELRDYLRLYAGRARVDGELIVRAPLGTGREVPVAFDLSRLTPRGILLPVEAGAATRCYLVRRLEDGRMMADVCKLQGELRRLYLPPGNYLVKERDPEFLLTGLMGEVSVGEGFEPLDKVAHLTERWVWTGWKGADPLAVAQISAATSIDPAEGGYFQDHYREAFEWSQFQGLWQYRARLSVAAPVVSLQRDGGMVRAGPPGSAPIAHERPSAFVGAVVDRRLLPIGDGYLGLGLDLGLGMSPGTDVCRLPLVDEEVDVYLGRARARLGYERPMGRWTFRGVAGPSQTLAFMPGLLETFDLLNIGQDATGVNECRGAYVERYRFNGAFLGSEIGREVRQRRWLEAGVILDLGQETFNRTVELSPTYYLSVEMTLGLRF